MKWKQSWFQQGLIITDGKRNKNLCNQIKESLKKFKGRSVILEESKDAKIEGLEHVLIAKGWKPPQKQRRRSRSASPPRQRNPNYKGKKNPLEKVGENWVPKKCF